MKEKHLNIINLISTEIYFYSQNLAAEQYNPGMDVDQSDETMINLEKKIKRLREIRSELEELFTGAIIK